MKQEPQEAEELDEMEDDDDVYEVACITAERYVKGKLEYHIKWAPPHDHKETWEPAVDLRGAMDKVEAWRRSRLSEEELAAETEAAAKATAEKEATAEQAKTAKEEEAKAAEEKKQRLCTAWQSAVQKVIDIIKERFEMLSLKGKPVEVPSLAPPEVEEELHTSLLALDPAYDRKLTLIADLPKMPILAK